MIKAAFSCVMNSEDEEPLQNDNKKKLLLDLETSDILLTTRNVSSKSVEYDYSNLETSEYNFVTYAMSSESVRDEIPAKSPSVPSSESATAQNCLCIEDEEEFSESSAILESDSYLKHGRPIDTIQFTNDRICIPEEEIEEDEEELSFSKKDHAITNSYYVGSKKKKRRKKKWIGICTTHCRYDSVRRVSKQFGMKEVGEDEDWTIFWTDYSVSLERVMEMKRFQKINHFPGMNEICRKDFLARNLNRLQKLFPKDYNCFPKTWCLPADYSEFQAYCRVKKNRTFICKPESGCQGRGIFLTKNPKDVKPGEHIICQQYINKDEACMHLTNYAINKNSDDFVRDDLSGSKRKLATVCQWLKDHDYDTDKMWASIEDVIIKTLISAHPIIKHNYKTCFPNHIRGSACFEILGFDVMLDRKMKAWLLEVNHSPSFHTDANLDREVKESLLYDSLNLLDLRSADRKKCLEEDRRRVKERLMMKQKPRESRLEEIKSSRLRYHEVLEKYENEHLGGFRRIYPASSGSDKYSQFFKNSCSLFQTTAAAKAREEAARAQLQEIRMKQEKLDMLKKTRSCRPEIKNVGESTGDRRKASTQERKAIPYKFRPATRHLNILSSRQLIPETQAVSGSLKPIDINEDEELERISGLVQRDTLIRSLGIIEQVHRMLHYRVASTALTNSSLLQVSLKSNLLQASNQASIKIPVSTGSPLYLKTSEPLIMPSYKYPVSKHYCSRSGSPVEFNDNFNQQKTNLRFHCSSIYGNVKHTGLKTFGFTSNSMPIEKEENAHLTLEVKCRGLLNSKNLRENSPLEKPKVVSDASSKEQRFNHLLLPTFLPQNVQQTVPFRLRYFTSKNSTLPLQVSSSKPKLKEGRNPNIIIEKEERGLFDSAL